MVVTINPDKTISINGVKTFLVGLGGVGNYRASDPMTVSNMQKYQDFTHVSDVAPQAFLISDTIPVLEQLGIGFFWGQRYAPPTDPVILNSSSFYGYFNCDEPFSAATQRLYSGTITQAQCIALSRCGGAVPYEWREGSGCWYPNEEPTVIARHNSFNNDVNHIDFLNHWGYMAYWANNIHCDAYSWDTYPVGSVLSDNWTLYTRDNAMYAYEIYSENSAFRGSDLNAMEVPVHAVIQGLGLDYPNGRYLALTPAETRCMTYSAVCMGAKGIRYWTAHFIHPQGNIDIGLAANPTLLAYYAQIAREIKSINDALVSPTLAYKWYARGLNPTTVTFNKNYTATVLGKTTENWSYILKQGSNSTWLIVVNKDPRPLSDVTISISGIVGGSTANLQGLETIGSGAAGRTVSINNGQFIDSFDGQAVHIYEITSEVLPPTGSLSLITDPPGASIELGGVLQPEKTNIVLANIPIGSYPLKLSLAGYYDHTETVTIYENQVTYVNVVLSPVPPPPPPPPIELSTADGLIKITIAGIAVAALYSWVNGQFKQK